MKITTRLSLFFLTALAMVLLGFSAALYCVAATYLDHQLDERLGAMIKVLAAAVEFEKEGVEWEPHKRIITVETGDTPIHWQVQTGDGRRVDGSPDAINDGGDGWRIARRQIPEQPFPLLATSQQRHDGEESTRYASLTVVAAVSEGAMRQTLQTLALTLIGLSLTLWTGAALAGRWLCGRALTPLRRMAQTARTITAAGLNRRLPIAHTSDELEDLGQAFNDLLERLQESFERQQGFTGNASHQLRTPLTAMLGQVEVALRRERSPEEYRRVLALVQQKSAQLREIVETLLFLARADAESKRPLLETLDLAAWLIEHVQGWSDHPRFADLRLDVGSGTPIIVKAQAALLRQLVDNLLENACHYSKPGKPIALRLSAGEANVFLSVQDKGCGIEPADLARVFEPFFRAEQVRQQGHIGIGLGLAVARRIAEALDGELQATSSPGNGSCFSLRLHAWARGPVK